MVEKCKNYRFDAFGVGDGIRIPSSASFFLK